MGEKGEIFTTSQTSSFLARENHRIAFEHLWEMCWKRVSANAVLLEGIISWVGGK